MKRVLFAFLLFVALCSLFVWWASGITIAHPTCDATDDSATIPCP